mmetsp:Transcript_3533/g.14681  ORF Transcript_3533/g.14681 Transcript_3533/m.14681 type:complete len:382 (+) Transcript_3533:242-1387(+)
MSGGIFAPSSQIICWMSRAVGLSRESGSGTLSTDGMSASSSNSSASAWSFAASPAAAPALAPLASPDAARSRPLRLSWGASASPPLACPAWPRAAGGASASSSSGAPAVAHDDCCSVPLVLAEVAAALPAGRSPPCLERSPDEAGASDPGGPGRESALPDDRWAGLAERLGGAPGPVRARAGLRAGGTVKSPRCSVAALAPVAVWPDSDAWPCPLSTEACLDDVASWADPRLTPPDPLCPPAAPAAADSLAGHTTRGRIRLIASLAAPSSRQAAASSAALPGSQALSCARSSASWSLAACVARTTSTAGSPDRGPLSPAAATVRHWWPLSDAACSAAAFAAALPPKQPVALGPGGLRGGPGHAARPLASTAPLPSPRKSVS